MEHDLHVVVFCTCMLSSRSKSTLNLHIDPTPSRSMSPEPESQRASMLDFFGGNGGEHCHDATGGPFISWGITAFLMRTLPMQIDIPAMHSVTTGLPVPLNASKSAQLAAQLLGGTCLSNRPLQKIRVPVDCCDCVGFNLLTSPASGSTGPIDCRAQSFSLSLMRW